MAKKEESDDLDLFRREMEGIKPLKTPDRVMHTRPKPSTRPRQRERDEDAVMDELLDLPEPGEGPETGEELSFLRTGYQSRYLKRLKRGKYAIRDHIDLHGMNEATAGIVLRQFISESAAAGLGCVRVVHGKGLRSRDFPKLKVMTNRLLQRHPRVVAFASCRPIDGGTGAVTVLLRENKSASS